MNADIVQRLTTYASGGCPANVRQLCLDAVDEISSLRGQRIPTRGTLGDVTTLADKLRPYDSTAEMVGVPTELLKEVITFLERAEATTKVDVIIPTRSNQIGLAEIMVILKRDPIVGKIVIVADGHDAYHLSKHRHPDTTVVQVSERAGIHRMWNAGLEYTSPLHHVLFLNDDVTVNPDTLVGMSATLDRNPELGIVCPNYSGEEITDEYRSVTDTCRGRYNGTGGLGGFAMMLRNRLAETWRFDERMRWWYGDDDVLNHVTIRLGMKAGICRDSTCSDNTSYTINNDPPPGFAQIVAHDRRVFTQKWAGK